VYCIASFTNYEQIFQILNEMILQVQMLCICYPVFSMNIFFTGTDVHLVEYANLAWNRILSDDKENPIADAANSQWDQHL